MRHIPIEEIAGFVYRRFPNDQVKALAMVDALEVYFDDSGTHGESLITTISGFMAPTNTWKQVEAGWLGVLQEYKSRYGITWYHATDVANWREEWAKAPLNVCRDAPMVFATVLSKSNVLPIWSAVVNEDFERYATPEFRTSFPTPFDLCFYEAMVQLHRWCKETLNATHVLPCIAHGDYMQRISDAHDRYLTDGDFAEYIGPLLVGSPRRVVPLQTADLLAYEFYHWWKDTEYPAERTYIDRPVLYRSIQRNEPAMRGACYSGEGFKYAVERHAARRKGVREG